jgi:hypothetical protein
MTNNSLDSVRKLILLGFLAAAVVLPATTFAQDKPAPKDATTKDATPKDPVKKPLPGPFHGKLVALDKTAKTITVGKRTFQITSESKISKGGKPAQLADGVVGEEVSGYVKPTDSGKLVATTVHFGPKPETKPAEPKK